MNNQLCISQENFENSEKHKEILKIQKSIKRYWKLATVTLEETSLGIQWLRIFAPNAGGPGLIPGQGTRSYMPQQSSHAMTIRAHMLQLRPSSQVNK